MSRPSATLQPSPLPGGPDDPAPPLGARGEASPPVHRSAGQLHANIAALAARGAIEPAIAMALVAEPGHHPGPSPTAAPWSDAVEKQLDGLRAERGEVVPPIVIAGLWDARLAMEAHAAARHGSSGSIFRRPVLIVHEEVASLAGALRAAGLRTIIDDDAAEWFLGPGAVDRVRDWLHARVDEALPQAVIGQTDHPRSARLIERLARQLLQLTAKQQSAARTLGEQAAAACSGLSPLEARSRFGAALRGGRQLRVLICGSRYTTYVKHSAEDLATAFRSIGHHPRVLLERDDSSRLTSLGYLRAVAEHAPDLIVIINYTRAMLGEALPADIPCVCWIQDAMPQFFAEEAGRAQSELDMIAGNTMPELFTKYHFPQAAAMPFCVPASAAKFHPEPVGDSLHARYECDLAFVSHHSEAPDEMRDRLAQESSAGPRSGELLDLLHERAVELTDRAAKEPTSGLAVSMASEAFRAVYGNDPTTQQCSTLLHSILLPLAGRVFRHRSLEWAAEIADRRGWRLRLYGNGWERSDRFATYAAGPVEHGEPLRACYQAAAATLHLDINTLTHQRVFECALSGGLPVARFFADSLTPLANAAADELLELAVPRSTDADGSRVYSPEQSPLATLLDEQRAALALAPRGEPIRVPPHASPLGRFYRDRIAAPFDAPRIFGGVQDITFHDSESLEQVLARAIDDPRWRADRSSIIREGVERHTTTEVFAKRLIAHAARIIGWREAWLGLGHSWPPRPEDVALYSKQLEDILNAE